MDRSCKIQKIGSFLVIDNEGYIVNTVSATNIQPEWREAVNFVINEYRKNYGEALHSVYLRGSVAKGGAIKGISDIDTFAIVNKSKEGVDRDWTGDFRERFNRKFPFINGVELIVSPLEGFENRKGQRILIKTQSICLYGENLADVIPPLKPGLDTIQHLQHLEQEIKKSIEFLSGKHDEEEIKRECAWIMKRILRGGFELTMERSGQYTRDRYPCYEGFSEYYPEKREGMYEVLKLAVCPTTNKEEIKIVLSDTGLFVAKEYEVLEKNRSRVTRGQVAK